MGIFGRKKKGKRNNDEIYDVTSDPSMTRWEDRVCSSCGQNSTHKISRDLQGSSEASIRCTKCGHWENTRW